MTEGLVRRPVVLSKEETRTKTFAMARALGIIEDGMLTGNWVELCGEDAPTLFAAHAAGYLKGDKAAFTAVDSKPGICERAEALVEAKLGSGIPVTWAKENIFSLLLLSDPRLEGTRALIIDSMSRPVTLGTRNLALLLNRARSYAIQANGPVLIVINVSLRGVSHSMEREYRALIESQVQCVPDMWCHYKSAEEAGNDGMLLVRLAARPSAQIDALPVTLPDPYVAGTPGHVERKARRGVRKSYQEERKQFLAKMMDGGTHLSIAVARECGLPTRIAAAMVASNRSLMKVSQGCYTLRRPQEPTLHKAEKVSRPVSSLKSLHPEDVKEVSRFLQNTRTSARTKKHYKTILLGYLDWLEANNRQASTEEVDEFIEAVYGSHSPTVQTCYGRLVKRFVAYTQDGTGVSAPQAQPVGTATRASVAPASAIRKPWTVALRPTDEERAKIQSGVNGSLGELALRLLLNHVDPNRSHIEIQNLETPTESNFYRFLAQTATTHPLEAAKLLLAWLEGDK